MSKLVTPLLGLALATWIIGWTWWFSKNYCGTAISTPETPALSISDGTFQTSSVETFSFGLSSHKPTVTEGTDKSLNALVDYLIENPNRELELSGIFGSLESNPTVYDNLGIGRAESIKEKLVSFGVDSEQLKTKGIRVDNSLFENDKLKGGVYFTFMDKKEEEDVSEVTLDPVENNNFSFFEGYTVHYNTSQYELDYNNEDLFNYLKSLKRYLRKNADRKVVITGHTDNVGNKRTNEKLSEARARKIRRYLVDTGVRRSQVQIDYVAESDPKASNDTFEGRRMNRRVEISVQ